MREQQPWGAWLELGAGALHSLPSLVLAPITSGVRDPVDSMPKMQGKQKC